MKKFISIYLMLFVFIETFVFFAGFIHFSFFYKPYRAGALWALVLTGVVIAFLNREEKIEELEKRIQKLEEQMAETHSERK